MTAKHKELGVIAALAMVGALAASFLLGGVAGFTGMLLGLGGATFGVMGLILVTQLVAHSSSTETTGRKGVLIPVLFFLAKIPVYVGLGFLANRLGGAGFGCFLAGVVLVYSGVVVGAIVPKAGTQNDLSE